MRLICPYLSTVIHFKYFYKMGTCEMKQEGCCHISYDRTWSSILILTGFLIGYHKPMLNNNKKKEQTGFDSSILVQFNS